MPQNRWSTGMPYSHGRTRVRLAAIRFVLFESELSCAFPPFRIVVERPFAVLFMRPASGSRHPGCIDQLSRKGLSEVGIHPRGDLTVYSRHRKPRGCMAIAVGNTWFWGKMTLR